MNKQGTDKIISVYWFAILFIVAAAVVYMAAVFYGEPYDVREVEANIMINQIADCLSEGGKLKSVWETLNQDNFLQECNLNFDVEDIHGWKEQEQYYVRVDFENRAPISVGSMNLRGDCYKKGKNFPVCVDRSFYVLDNEDNPEVIKIRSLVRKTEKNVR